MEAVAERIIEIAEGRPVGGEVVRFIPSKT
jgi:hypothetical protein